MDDDEPCSEYASHTRSRAMLLPPATTRSMPHASFANLLQSVNSDIVSPEPSTSPLSVNSNLVARASPLNNAEETYVYTYTLTAASAPLDFVITVEHVAENPGHFMFSLAVKADAVERDICSPVVMRLTVDPSSLAFSVFMFPPKTSLPAGCLHSLRVWLRVGGVDHRLFSHDDLWVGKDPDFQTINDASFAALKSRTNDTGVYQAMIGGVPVNFFLRWHRVEYGLYNLTLEYEAGGAGRMLMDYCLLRLGCDPSLINFILYSVRIPSTPPNASHRLRLWICSVPPSLAASPPGTVPFICQRLWKFDNFKLGKDLDFSVISDTTVVAVPKIGRERFPSTSNFLPAANNPSYPRNSR